MVETSSHKATQGRAFQKNGRRTVGDVRLSDLEIEGALAGMPSWSRAGDAIGWTQEFPSFLAGIAFVDRVARLAEAVDHHPDIDIRYRTVRLTLTTHSEGGLTKKDIDFAQHVDTLDC